MSSGVLLTSWGGRSVSELRDAWGVPVLEAYACLGSTNDRARELATETARAFGVVVADEQTDGRGRRGARWHSPAGSGLWMSVVLPEDAGLHVPLLVGLACARAIQEASPAVRVGIEWPNDLVVGRRKLGGILCEATPGAVVAGIGINLHPPGAGFPAALEERVTSLEAHGEKALSSSELAGFVIGQLKRLVASPTGRLEPDILDELAARDALAARAVVTEEHGPGTARGIDSDGALLLERPDGSRVRVRAGSVRPA